MFQRWGFLLGEIWGLLLLAALLGLLAGWLIWGRRGTQVDTTETDRLRAALDSCTGKSRDQAARIATLEADLTKARTAQTELAAPLQAASVLPPPAPQAADPAPAELAPAKPQGLAAARDGQPDDLKLIKGIGPKLEALCHTLGFYHFDQIAAWTAKEIAWVDDNLEGFKGRVTRDNWVAQARDLMNGKETR